MVKAFGTLGFSCCAVFVDGIHQSHKTWEVKSDGSMDWVDLQELEPENLPEDPPENAGTMSCSMEKAMKRTLGMSGGTTSIRAVFHDAMDQDNLLLKNTKTQAWEPFELTEGHHYGGIDGCLYSPLSNGWNGYPNPDHNRGVPGVFPRAAALCRATCNLKPNLKICKGPKVTAARAQVSANCIVDATILSANAVISKTGGPDVPMLWGHEKGDCGYNGVVTPHTKFCRKDCQARYSGKPALRFAPSFTALDDAPHFFETFKRLGFDAKDHVALMGAHSVGIIEPCAAGLNGIEVGPFCKQRDRNIPKVTDEDVLPKCKLTHRHSCWFRVGQNKNGVAPVHKTTNGRGKGSLKGHGDGGVWDRSPNSFDNDYFKIMDGLEYEGKNQCCGSCHHGICKRTGTMSRIVKRYNAYEYMYSYKTGKECMYASGQWNRPIQPTRLMEPYDTRWIEPKNKNTKCYNDSGEWIDALNSGNKNPLQGVHPAHIRTSTTRANVTGACGEGKPAFCRDDRKDRTHMKAMNVWHRTPAPLLKNAANHGNILRVVRLPGDWALLAGEETKTFISEFASDEAKFHDAFANAWEKVLRKTHAPLESCSGEVDEAQVEKFVAEYNKRLSLVQQMQDSDPSQEDHRKNARLAEAEATFDMVSSE